MNTYTTPEDSVSVNTGDSFCPYTPTDEMVAEQVALEESAVLRGAAAFHRANARAQQAGVEDQTGYGATLLLRRVQSVAEGVKAFLVAQDTGKPGKRHVAARPLRSVAPTTAAYIALQAVIASLQNPRSLVKVAGEIGGRLEDEIRLAAVRESEGKHYRRIVTAARARTSYHFRRVYAIRGIREYEDEGAAWALNQRVHVGLVLIDIIVETTGIIELSLVNNKGKSSRYVKATPETLEWITRRNAATEMMRPFYDPMVVPPREWDGPYSGGYLTSSIPPLSLVKTKNRQYLEELAGTGMPVVYDAINAVQRTAWQVNAEVLAVMTHCWDNDLELANLPNRSGLARPEKPADIDTNEQAKKDWRRKAAVVWQRNRSHVGSRIAVNGVLTTARRFAKYPAIYFPCQYDFRGRLYAVTTLSPQGADYTKGLLRFSAGKPLGEFGAKWLAYQGANLAGNDKVSLAAREQWVLDNEDAILACAADPLGDTRWATVLGGVEIDSPWQFLAFCFEWAGYRREGESFVSRIPVAMDGSCSGIQHFSAMLRDPIGGAAVNLVPADKPQDVYGIVAAKVNEALKIDLENGTEDALTHSKTGTAYVKEGTKTLAAQWLDFGVTRKVTKRSVMTMAYGSKEFGFRQQLLEDIILPAKDAATDADGVVDAHAFPFTNDGNSAAGYMAKKIWFAVTETLVAATQAMDWLQTAARLVAKEGENGLPVRWATPVGFPVMQVYKDTKRHVIETSLAGRLQLYVDVDQVTMNSQKMANSISPNFVHSCDAAHLTLTVALAQQEGVVSFAVVHDSFGTTAADMDTLFATVRGAFVEIYDGLDVLGEFRSDIEAVLCQDSRKALPPVPPTGSLEVARVKESDYCFA